MKLNSHIASILNIILNIILFSAKITIGIIFSSIALISDAINSLTDIVSSIIIYISIKIGSKKPDDSHPFGHSRSEPIAALFSGVIMWVLSIEILKSSVNRIISKETLDFSPLLIYVLLIAICTKIIMFLYSRLAAKLDNSPAMSAASKDHLNDIVISAVALIGISLNKFTAIYWFDSLAGFLIGLWVFYVGYDILRENIDYLMGKKPHEEEISKVKDIALSIDGVTGINDCFAQYLGHLIQVELHIEVDKEISLQKAHDIGKLVKKALEDDDIINNAFIHIDPV